MANSSDTHKESNSADVASQTHAATQEIHDGSGLTPQPTSSCSHHGRPLPPSWVALYPKPKGTPTKRLRIVTIGAGLSALGFAYQLQHAYGLTEGGSGGLTDGEEASEAFAEHCIYEANSDIGGTWLVNTYPGVACDFPAHVYTFPFEPNPNWSSYYASGPEIQAYIKRTVAKYHLDRDVKLQHRVEHARFDEAEGRWYLKIRRGLEHGLVDDVCDVLVSATGFLSRWCWPSIPGLVDDYKGHRVHTAAWKDAGEFDYAGKRIGVIGNGSSAIQVLPQLAPQAGHLINFIRNPSWITPGFGSVAIQHADNYLYTEEEKQAFARDPEKLKQYRKSIQAGANGAFGLFEKGGKAQEDAQRATAELMLARLGGDEELARRMIPSFDIGCRRASPGPGYLEAFTRDNVDLVTQPIERVTSSGIRTTDGNEFELDAIVCATGFDVSYRPPWPLVGRWGVALDEHWKDEPYAYLGLMAAGFPNLFMFAGPNSPIGHGGLMPTLQWAAEWMCKWIKKMAEEDIKFVDPKPEVVEELNAYGDEIMQTLVWSGGCRSWYKNHRVDGRVTAVWPGSGLSYYEMTHTLRPEDFEIVYRSKNRFRFMGNGRTKMEYSSGADLAFYVYK
ncbi:hypothetical protein BD289DRAFT_293034 [Coniella lustricola]|uniref:Uncharacterized protein n=1 Tax=Coniella lustricola TaxID=2025994 RepID=A0A2T3A576_9PEZI|nr:hypothetical protein BD289DRAFT_293034 [Coniella lustricola]